MKRGSTRLLTWWGVFTRILQRPSILTHRFRIVSQNSRLRRERERWLSGLAGAPASDVRRYIAEIESDKEFLQDIRVRIAATRHIFPLRRISWSSHLEEGRCFSTLSLSMH